MAEPNPAPAEAVADEPPVYQFEDMRLKAGDRLQMQLPASVTHERPIVRLIGYLDKQCLLVTAPAGLGLQKPLMEGDRVIARVFMGQGAFGFVSFVDKVIRVPFDYLHLSFPKQIQGLMVRKAPRVKTEIAATVETSSGNAEAHVSNLSATGMLLHSATALGANGDNLSVTLPLNLYDVKTELRLRGRIKAVSSAAIEGGGDEHRCGVEFLDLQPNETLILQSVVHHELAKHPHSVV
ncbi:MAG: flagellar brake protein [Betaproteobacteria bacterium]|nr:flagellar brake protein [Betaproteobacteria bacterium]